MFPFYSFIAPTPTAESDQNIARRVAEQLTKSEAEEGESLNYGSLLVGFPFNTNQALFLDRYLNGVNLAIYCKHANESSDFASSVRPLLDYYDERVRHGGCRAHCWS